MSGEARRDEAVRIAQAISNEQVRLTGTALNNRSVAVVVSGFALPLINLLYGAAEPRSRYWGIFELMWLTFGCVLHSLARLYMRKFQP